MKNVNFIKRVILMTCNGVAVFIVSSAFIQLPLRHDPCSLHTHVKTSVITFCKNEHKLTLKTSKTQVKVNDRKKSINEGQH